MKLLMVLLSVLPLTCFCQNDDSTKTRKVLLGITYSPDYCYRTLKPDASDIAQSITALRNESEMPVYGYTTGLSVIFGASKKLVLETGIQYSKKGEQTKPFDVVWVQPGPSLPVKVSTVRHYCYLDIPLKANYFFARSRGISLKFLKKIMHGKVPASTLGFFVSGGLSANVFLNEKSVLTFEYSDGHTDDEAITAVPEYSPVNVAAMVGLGMHFFVAPRISVRVEPIFRHAITPIVDAPIRQYSYSAGINAGIYFSL